MALVGGKIQIRTIYHLRFCICQYRVYEEINIQNTGGTDYAEQIIFKGSRYM